MDKKKQVPNSLLLIWQSLLSIKKNQKWLAITWDRKQSAHIYSCLACLGYVKLYAFSDKIAQRDLYSGHYEENIGSGFCTFCSTRNEK
jgi:hypothetical protein